jgi:hypothetical protein
MTKTDIAVTAAAFVVFVAIGAWYGIGEDNMTAAVICVAFVFTVSGLMLAVMAIDRHINRDTER